MLTMTFPLHTIIGVSRDAIWHHINLDEHARADFPFSFKRPANPLLDPDICAKWVDKLAREAGAAYTYGGYMEDRSHLWRGSYLPKNRRIHLGIDINVRAGTHVKCPIPFRVVEAFSDPDQNGGWGQRVIVKTAKGYVLFAHLHLFSFLRVGGIQPAGDTIGFVAEAADNGGWYPHLHIQGLRDLSLMNGLDGYGRGGPRDVRNYPHPFDLLS